MLEFTNYEFVAILVSVGTLGFTIGVKVGSLKTTTEHNTSCHIKGEHTPLQRVGNKSFTQPKIKLFMTAGKVSKVICPFYNKKTCTATGKKCIQL